MLMCFYDKWRHKLAYMRCSYVIHIIVITRSHVGGIGLNLMWSNTELKCGNPKILCLVFDCCIIPHTTVCEKTQFYEVKPKFRLARHVTSRHDSKCSTCRAHAFWLCRACRTARLDTLVSTRSTCPTCLVVSRRDVTSQVEFGLKTAAT